MWNKRGFSQAGFTAPNPPNGAVVTYYLKSEIEVSPELKKKKQTPVKITVTDEAGNMVRTVYGPSKAGVNRATWSLEYQEATKLNIAPEREPSEFFDNAGGPPATPGTYKIAVTVNGKTETTTVQVEGDPRFPIDMKVAAAQTNIGLETRDMLSAFNEMLNRVDSLRTQAATVQKLLTVDDEASVTAVSYKPVLDSARDLDKKLKDFQERFYNSDSQGGNDRLHFLAKLYDRVSGLSRQAGGLEYNEAPRPLLQEELEALRPEVQKVLGEFNAMLSGEVNTFNKLALEKGANTLYAGVPVEWKGSQAGTAVGK
jgi:hypothetical protein